MLLKEDKRKKNSTFSVSISNKKDGYTLYSFLILPTGDKKIYDGFIAS